MKKALVADEDLGFGSGGDDAPDPLGDQLFAALREEPLLSDKASDIRSFLADALKLEDRYRAMLAQLGNKATRYRGQPLRPLEAAFSEFGLEILGPTKNHLQVCADELQRLRAGARRRAAARRGGGGDDAEMLVALYRQLRDQSVDGVGLVDMAGPGAALNNQSIVVKVIMNGTPTLLTGDQQFAKAEIRGLDESMATLRAKVVEAGPFPVMKVAHHGSYNGLDSDLIASCESNTLLFSGGSNDPGHPSANVLDLLRQQKDSLTWLRTDKNGRIDVQFPAAGPGVTFERGKANDFRPNPNPSDLPSHLEPGAIPAGGERAAAASPQVRVERTANGYVEFSASAKLPPDVDSIQVTLDIRRTPRERRTSGTEASTGPPKAEPAKNDNDPEPGEFAKYVAIPNASRLPNLLFVTDQGRLEGKIGKEATLQALGLIRAAGKDIHLLADQNQPWRAVQQKLRSASYAGVVLLGDYDVVPAARLDCLAELRNSLKREDVANDSDAFVVWSDDVYGDIEEDRDPEAPVSRIPDARSGSFLLRCLTVNPAAEKNLWGLRNLNRPFADRVQRRRPGGEKLKTSGPLVDRQIPPSEFQPGSLYFMLHGADYDTAQFWGEQGGTLTNAFAISNVPEAFAGCVFAGCCYGALIAQLPAARVRQGDPYQGRAVQHSIAMSFLNAGALAFVGCTGTHYSPNRAPYRFFGGPMHSAFFESYDKGEPPAKALLEAKQAYARDMPHGFDDMAAGQAIELKTLREFTCLGLGW